MDALEQVENGKYWAEAIGSYGSLIHEHSLPFQPMLELARTVSSWPLGRALYPLGSHDDLGFCRVGAYPERLHRPQVWVKYRSRGGTFEVVYRECRGGPRETVLCSSEEVLPILERILRRLVEADAAPSTV